MTKKIYIISKQKRFLELLGEEVKSQAWELFIGVNPLRKCGERKIMNRLCNIRTDVADNRLNELRGKNAKRQDIYFRPSHTLHPKGEVPNGSCVAYPYFVLDDVEVEVSKEIARRHRCFLVSTSFEGGCQVWIVCNRAIDTITRHKIQSHFASRGICDKGATLSTITHPDGIICFFGQAA